MSVKIYFLEFYLNLNKTKKPSRETKNFRVLLFIFSLSACLFSQSVFAEKRAAKLVEYERKKSAVASLSPSPAPKPSKPEAPQITNIERIYEGKDYVVKIRARKFKQVKEGQ